MAVSGPKKIGKYDVIDVIGKGGMGIVYRAKDPFLDRLVAIKIMTISSAEYPDLLDRFFREAKATASFQHPNIVTVYELGEHEGSPYLAMQYLEGASLETIIRSHQNLTLLQKIDIIIQVCHGLAYAHQLKVVHRDIKPGNIMVLKDGSVKIVDFGIARIGDTNFTRTGQFMGSLNYMSLEQLNEKLQVDQRTDVYSTGVVLYQFLTGVLPFEAEGTGATLMKILSEAPPPFSKYLSSFPSELEAITLRALAKDRDQRYASADEFAIELTQLQDRLKQEAISGYLQQAEFLIEKNDLFQAHEQLVEVLKIDKQHTRAASLLRSLRKQIEKEQSVERARQFRGQAEEAYRREEFESALSYLDQAISLDQTNVDLPKLRASVQSAKTEAEHLRQVLQRAENAHRAGNLDTAKQAIEEVLARRPNDTRVKSLYRMIQKELEERLKQKRMENLLEAARKEITSRRYTAAFDILKEAEKIDPDAPQLRSLLDKFTTAREQEQRRRELEQATRQVEQALNTDDHQSALSLIADGLRRFPGDPALIKLRDLAETQKEAAQTKSFVREKVSAAREILNAGNAAGALKLLEDALRKAPGNPHLESLVSMAQERLAQDRDEQAKSTCIQQANNALGRRAYPEAIRLLEAGQLRFAAAPEIDSLLRFAREQQSKEARQQEVEGSVRRAHEFLRAQEYDRAIELLESILPRFPDDEVRIVLEQARRRRDDLNREVAAAIAKAEQFVAEGSPAKALEFLQSQPTAYRRSQQFRELLQAAMNQPRATERQSEIPPSEQEWEAPPPSATVIWDRNSMAPPELERPVASRVSTRTAPQRPPTPPQEPLSKARQVTRQQKVMIAAIAAILVIGVLAIWMFSGSKTEKKTQIPHGTPPTVGPVVETPPPIPPPVALGALSVRTNVEGADIFVGKDLKGSTNSSKKFDINLPLGSYVVHVEKPGYEPSAPRNVEVASNNDAPVKFTLNPSNNTPNNVPPKDSYLVITGNPGADVLVDGNVWGKVPAEAAAYVKVTPGSEHRIELSLKGYEPWTDRKTVKAGERLAVSAAMRPLSSPPPSVISFSASPLKIRQGESVTLKWQTANATEVSIDPGIGAVKEANGQKQVDPNDTTTYTLTAKGTGQPARSSPVVVTVIPAPLPTPTATLTAPSSVQKGQSVTLNWTTQNAKSVSIDNGIGSVDPKGQKQVTPGATTTYTLTAKGADGTPVTSSARVEVTSAPPPPPPPPHTDSTGSDATAIMDALRRLGEAYGTESVDEMQKVWPRMSKQQKSKLNNLFNSVRALRTQFDSCSSPSVSGDVATLACTQTISYTAGGKFQPGKPVPVSISLKKAAGGWQIESVEGK
jgi:eukaryotic-like serine/threonine-protein kinase